MSFSQFSVNPSIPDAYSRAGLNSRGLPIVGSFDYDIAGDHFVLRWNSEAELDAWIKQEERDHSIELKLQQTRKPKAKERVRSRTVELIWKLNPNRDGYLDRNTFADVRVREALPNMKGSALNRNGKSLLSGLLMVAPRTLALSATLGGIPFSVTMRIYTVTQLEWRTLSTPAFPMNAGYT